MSGYYLANAGMMVAAHTLNQIAQFDYKGKKPLASNLGISLSLGEIDRDKQSLFFVKIS